MSDPQRIADGLPGEWLGLDDVLQLSLFAGRDRDFRIKLHSNFGISPKAAPRVGDTAEPARSEPTIKAAVQRRYSSGEIICEAGAYGSTAFLILEGSAVAELPQAAAPRQIAGRSAGSLAMLASLFRRRRHSPPVGKPGALEIGEVSAFASMSCERPPPQRSLGPGDLFGIDTCINFYPREATVRAASDCVVLEMLRSALDTIRACGEAGDEVAAAYRDSAIRNQVAMSALFRSLSDADSERLAAACELLTPDSEAIRDAVVYAEGMPADALYLVRSGNIKLSQHTVDGEMVVSYLGRGSAFGFESVVTGDESNFLQLVCTSHPDRFASSDIGDQLTFGRAKSCDVVFPADERGIGRQHCRLQRRGDDVYLAQGSTMSVTLLNGEPVTESLLRAGDRITIGSYVFTLRPLRRSPGTVDTPLRRATARGLDQFEIIRVPDVAMKSLLHDARVQAAAAAAAHSLTVVPTPAPRASPGMADDLINLNLYNSQNVLLIDLDRCTRCDECVRACADAHDGVARFTRDGPRLGKYLVAMACRSCTDPQCMIGCPVGSIHRLDSLEIRIEDWCIGCQSCAKNCPYGNINMVDLTVDAAPQPAISIDARTNSMRATVCDLCAGYDAPNCVYACPHDAAIRVNPAAFLTAADKG